MAMAAIGMGGAAKGMAGGMANLGAQEAMQSVKENVSAMSKASKFAHDLKMSVMQNWP